MNILLLYIISATSVQQSKNADETGDTEFRGVALNSLFCADVLRPLDLVPLTDFTYKYQRGSYTKLCFSKFLQETPKNLPVRPQGHMLAP